MPNTINDVYTGQLQGTDSALLEQAAQAEMAKAQLGSLGNSPSMVRALRDYQTPLPTMQGQGMAATAPSILEALGSLAMRQKGSGEIDNMEALSNTLRGNVAKGAMAEQQLKLQQKDYADKMAANAANNRVQAQIAAAKLLDENQTTRANTNMATQLSNQQTLATDAKTRTIAKEDRKKEADKIGGTFVDMQSPDGEIRRVLENKKIGKAYLGDTEIQDYHLWKEPPTAKRGLVPTGSERSKYRQAYLLRDGAKELDGIASDFTPTQRAQVDSAFKQGLTSMLPDFMQRLAEESTAPDPGVRSYMQKLNSFQSELSKLATGLQVSGFEMSDRQTWSPNAPGISQEERDRRTQNVHDKLFAEIEVYERYYSDYTMGAASGEKTKRKYSDMTDAELAEELAKKKGVTP